MKKQMRLPALPDWKCYYFNGKQNSYDIEQDGVKYCIEPVISNTYGHLMGYRLTAFDYTPGGGHQSIGASGTVFHGTDWGSHQRAASAAKVAREAHAKRPK